MITATFLMSDGFQAEVDYDDEQELDRAIRRAKENGFLSLRRAEQTEGGTGGGVYLYQQHIVRVSYSETAESSR